MSVAETISPSVQLNDGRLAPVAVAGYHRAEVFSVHGDRTDRYSQHAFSTGWYCLHQRGSTVGDVVFPSSLARSPSRTESIDVRPRADRPEHVDERFSPRRTARRRSRCEPNPRFRRRCSTIHSRARVPHHVNGARFTVPVRRRNERERSASTGTTVPAVGQTP